MFSDLLKKCAFYRSSTVISGAQSDCQSANVGIMRDMILKRHFVSITFVGNDEKVQSQVGTTNL